MYGLQMAEQRYEEHKAWVDRVNREAWKYEQAAPRGGLRQRGAAALIALAMRLAPSLHTSFAEDHALAGAAEA